MKLGRASPQENYDRRNQRTFRTNRGYGFIRVFVDYILLLKQMKIPFCKAEVGREEIKAVKKVLKSGWLTTGKETAEFEKEFAEYVGSKYAVAVSSGTMALELSLRSLNLTKKDIVIVPSFTFCATAQAAINSGARVYFGEIELINLTLDPKSPTVSKYLNFAKAIIPVHLGGNKAFTDYNIPVIEDSAHRIERNQCLNNPNTVCFSFYPTKNMTTGEGGMIATNDIEKYKWLLKARSHGRNKLVGSGYEVEFNGLKGNLPDILSAIGRVQLRKLDRMNAQRNQVVSWYNRELGQTWTGNHLYPIFLKNRKEFMDFMEANGVQCSAHFTPLHKMKAFYFAKDLKLPLTEALGETEVSLPLYPSLKEKQVKDICNLIKNFKYGGE